MASKRWDLCVSHKDKNGNWRSQKIGVVFEGDKGQLNVKIDPGIAVSTPEGVNLTAWPPKDREERGGGGGRGGQQQSRGGAAQDYMGANYDQGGGDDIPF